MDKWVDGWMGVRRKEGRMAGLMGGWLDKGEWVD